MRSGIECVLFFILIRRGGSAITDDYFRPTPIPLNDWREVRVAREHRAGALQDSLLPAAGPARYWEDALRHSVYLTLVRDKIDKLIAKGDYSGQSKEVDDRDLWDKVKRAPFERIDTEYPIPYADVATIAKGRLMEEHGGFRFTDDDQFKENCTHSKCMDGVKALWAVKRVRQRDVDSLPGQYYELTFSVVSTQKKHKKRFEKPARTFTVRESDPERILEAPQESRFYEPLPVSAQTPRPDRTLWYHKNIMPPLRSQARQHRNGLERLFSSLFLEDDDDQPLQRHKPKQVISHVYQQHSKVGYVGSPSDHQQKKLNPYGPKLQGFKYARPISSPPPQPPIQQHYLDIDAIGVVSNPYIQDHRYGPPNKGKTPRPAVLPTPPNPVLPQKNFSIEATTKLRPNKTEETTPQPESMNTYKPYNKHKPSNVKISYVTEHVRPPVYNAPPGVFVTMDKKPFKPMPPLRLVQSSKHHKTIRPVDFRPSPQVLDYQFSEPDPLFDTAFRPITVNYATTNTTDRAVTAASDNHTRKSNTTKKPPKKHENIKTQRVTTTVPEIITAHRAVEDGGEEWTNVLGAFAKTTPMAAERETETSKAPDTTTAPTSSSSPPTAPPTAPPTTAPATRKRTTTTTEAPTTSKPKKRTRPPHKFVKPEKAKKHKRITTTTTEVPARTKNQPDLTPQASSAAAAAELPSRTTESSMTSSTTNGTPSNMTSSATSSTPSSTTSAPSTTSTASAAASPPAGSKPAPLTTPPSHTMSMTTTVTLPEAIESDRTRIKNRYRQSTLKYRSTSEKLDKKEVTRTVLPPTGKFAPRRKGSKFHGHVPVSTPLYTDKQFDEAGREDHVVSPYKSKTEITTEAVTAKLETSSLPTTAAHEVADHVYITSESPGYMQSRDDIQENSTDETEEEQESRDDLEYAPDSVELVPLGEESNEIIEIEHEPFENTEVTSTVSTATVKYKPKCKKKKLHNLTNTTEETKQELDKPEIAEVEDTQRNTSANTKTEISTTPDIFQEIFSGFIFDESPTESDINEATSKPELEELETTNHEKYIKADDDFADFFEAFDDKDRHPDGKFDDQYEYDDKEPSIDDEESLSQRDEDTRTPRVSNGEESYEDYEERPYSLLELIAME